jgi:endonuclease/exonuclease/phosphatase family metal-dependent hydrolase
MLHACIEIPHTALCVHCVCVHLNLLGGGRRRQLQHIRKIIDDVVPHAQPLILAGDFNDWSREASRELVTQLDVVESFSFLNGSYAATFPSQYPILRLDRVYARGLVPVSAMVLSGPEWKGLSDHAGLAVEFELSVDKSVTENLSE